MFHGNSQITIQRVANGWIVSLPVIMRAHRYEEFEAQARIMKREFVGEDDVLQNLQKKKNHEPEVKDLKEESVYIFYTFEEMINFVAMQTDGMIIDKFHPNEQK